MLVKIGVVSLHSVVNPPLPGGSPPPPPPPAVCGTKRVTAGILLQQSLPRGKRIDHETLNRL